MEASEREPSYYEVALTNRQVMGAFVILLTCLFGAFFAGVWFGQTSGTSAAPKLAQSVAEKSADGGQPIEKLTFFNRDAATTPATPSLSGATLKPANVTPSGSPTSAAPVAAAPPTAATESLRSTLEAEIGSHRESPELSTGSATPGERIQQKPRKQRSKPSAQQASASPVAPTTPSQAVSASSAPAAGTWIQVYSSANGDRARELAKRLRGSGFSVRLLETDVSGATTYRVRVGPYAARDEAERAASRLRREFRLDTWVTEQP